MLAALNGPAGAQQQRFAIRRPDVTITTSYELEDEERTTPFSSTDTQTDTYAVEADVETKGWVYHPAFNIYSINLRPKWQYEDIETAGASGTSSSRNNQLIFFGYTLDTTFLPLKPYTLNLFADRNRSEFSSSLSPDNVTESDTYRARLSLDYWNLPTEFTLERRELDFEGLTDYTNTTNTARVQTRHRTDSSSTTFRTEYSEAERELSTSTSSTDRYLVNATNSYRFGPDVRLTSTLIATDTTTDIEGTTGSTTTDNSFVTGSEALFLQHTPNFSTDYRAEAQYRNEDTGEHTRLFASGRARHMLYENLRTTFYTSAEDEELDRGDVQRYQSRLDFDYSRSIPWGYVSLFNGYLLNLEVDHTEEGFTNIFDESLALPGANLVFLANDDVDVTTIVVTDTTGLIIYAEGIDYVVSVIGDSVAISRTGVGSTIPDGATVLVDYRFLSQGPSTIGTRTISLGAEVGLWQTLRLFYQFTDSEDEQFSGEISRELTDDVTHRVGAEVRWRWSTSRAEYEIRDTTRVPLNRWRVQETLRFRPLDNLGFSVGAAYAETEFTDTGEETQSVSGTAGLQWRPVRWGQLRIDASQRRITGDIQDTNETIVVSRFDWRYRVWSGRFRHEFVDQEDYLGEQTRERHVFLVELTREF